MGGQNGCRAAYPASKRDWAPATLNTASELSMSPFGAGAAAREAVIYYMFQHASTYDRNSCNRCGSTCEEAGTT